MVLGGSMAGLLTARVLTDHFPRVTIVERDTLPPAPTIVAAYARAPHARVARERTRHTRPPVSRLFGGSDCGGRRRQAMSLGDCRWVFEGAPLARPRSDMRALMCTRPFLESQVRARVLALPSVSLASAASRPMGSRSMAARHA